MARSTILDPGQVLGLTLDRYQELLGFPPAAFNGILKAEEAECYPCAAIWTQRDRDMLTVALANAEQMREQELNYYVAPKQTLDEVYEYSFPLILSKKHLVAVGTETLSLIQSGVVLVLGAELTPNDPVTIVVATTVTDPQEIYVTYPGETVPIHPSSVAISGGFATINIPRSRLLLPSIDTNCTTPDFYENDNFLMTVDVYRKYIDPNDGAFFVWHGGASCAFPVLDAVAMSTQQCFPRIEDHRLAILRLYPANYAAGSWQSVLSTRCETPDHIQISYVSGRQNSVQTCMETARLAHTLLPEISPATDDLCKNCWEGDQDTKNMAMTPYGNMVGAVKCWASDSRAKVGYGGKTPRVLK